MFTLVYYLLGGDNMHKSNGGYEFWDNEKDNVEKMYLDGMSTNEIGKIYNCYGSTILNHLKRWGVPIRKQRYNALYKTDVDYFSKIDTEEKAYWIGLLLSDGHLSKSGTLMLYMKDLDIIEKLKKSLKSEHPIRYDKYGNPGINIKCMEYYEDLTNIGFHNRKSYFIDLDKVLSNIPKHLLHHFVRGLFDGDGSIKVYKYPYLNKPQYHLGFTGLKNVCEFVKSYLNIDRKLIKESNITYTCVTRDINKIREIYNILYKDSTIYLNRKYETFQKKIL